MRRFLLCFLTFCLATLATPVGAAEATWPQAAWQKFMAHLTPDETQKTVLRSLALEVGARTKPGFPANALLKWLDERSELATTRALKLETLYDFLLVARNLERKVEISEQRRALRAALAAQKLAHQIDDKALEAAIVEGFVLEHFDIADDDGSLGRFALLAPLEQRYLGFRWKDENDEELPTPNEKAACDFGRLQITLAPDAEAAAWPRARLALRLLRAENATRDEQSEALQLLRGIVPGEGALIFRSLIPALRQKLGAERAEGDDDDAIASGRYGKQPFTTSQKVAHAALLKHLDTGEAARVNLLEELADWGGVENKAADAFVSGRELRDLIKDAPKPAAVYAGVFRAARQADDVLQDPQHTADAAKKAIEDLEWALKFASNRLREIDKGWNFGDYTFHPVFDPFAARIFEAWILPKLDVLDDDYNRGNGRYEFIRSAPGVFERAFPLFKGAREAMEKVRSERGLKNDAAFQYWRERWPAKGRAAVDLCVRHHERESLEVRRASFNLEFGGRRPLRRCPAVA